MENQTKKTKKVDSLLKITFDFIIRQCKRDYNEEPNQIADMKWHETSLFCLAFKIKAKVFTDCFYWSMGTCEPFKCERFCIDIDHQKVPYKTGEEWNHYITFDCDG